MGTEYRIVCLDDDGRVEPWSLWVRFDSPEDAKRGLKDARADEREFSRYEGFAARRLWVEQREVGEWSKVTRWPKEQP